MSYCKLFPPLRLVLNTACTGSCFFCHHEGCNESNLEMPWEIINDCIEAARQLNISKISLTGGEPTLRTDLDRIVQEIKYRLPSVELGITTNGWGLTHLPRKTLEILDHISLSITSFNETTYRNYQGINPDIIFGYLQNYIHKTTINIVVVDDNKDELISLIDHCFSCGFSVDLMFEMESNDIPLQKSVLSALTEKFGLFCIQYGSTPVMIQYEQAGKRLRIKSPSVSNILKRKICRDCPFSKKCPEKVCALRVYPDGSVSPCLNGRIKSDKVSIIERISDLYPQLGICEDDLYSYFLSQD